jgi:hypothetical protein
MVWEVAAVVCLLRMRGCAIVCEILCALALSGKPVPGRSWSLGEWGKETDLGTPALALSRLPRGPRKQHSP